jgi:hypothetical protein
MINQSKPTQGTPETTLNIGSGFSLLIGGGYNLIIGAASAFNFLNQTRPVAAVTWDTWDVAWEDETRTWDELSSNFDGFNRPSSSMSNQNKP